VALTLRRELVRAAGGVVRRAEPSGPQVLLVHRPRYDDWTFPKGKAHRGESAQETALRDAAEETVSYARDLDVLRGTPPPLLVNRHASAGDSAQWVGDDSIRPLDDRGRRQAALLVEQLAPFRIERILSSPFTRCVQTVEPLAEARSLEVELIDDLAEGAGPKCVRTLMLELDGTAAAVCGHGPELVPLFGKTKKGATVIVEAADGELGELGRLPPPE
jgi:8-oxo-dGTP diphosphatase